MGHSLFQVLRHIFVDHRQNQRCRLPKQIIGALLPQGVSFEDDHVTVETEEPELDPILYLERSGGYTVVVGAPGRYFMIKTQLGL